MLKITENKGKIIIMTGVALNVVKSKTPNVTYLVRRK